LALSEEVAEPPELRNPSEGEDILVIVEPVWLEKEELEGLPWICGRQRLDSAS
jgi:hypothetical protein